MKDVENVTGHMGEGEAVTPSEEAGFAATYASGTSDAAANAEDTGVVADAGKSPETTMPAAPPGTVVIDPWHALVQVGAQLVSAIAAANDPKGTAHPWIERDPASGAASLKIPLPPPETTRHLADALALLAQTLRGTPP